MHALAKSLRAVQYRCSQRVRAVRSLGAAVGAMRSSLPLWIWSEYEEPLPRYLQINLMLFHHHAAEYFDVRLLNRSTLGRYVDLPSEFERIPYAVAASDFARISLLATHGGLYADLDFLVTRSLRPVRTLLEHFEIVSYSSNADNCTKGFVSNFAAVRPGSALWKETWDLLRKQLTRQCGTRARHKICCYSANSTPVPCRVPWAITDVIMSPISKRYAAEGRLSVYCHAGAESFTPHVASNSYKCTNIFHLESLQLASRRETDQMLPTRPGVDLGGAQHVGQHGRAHRHHRHSDREGMPAFWLAADKLGCSTSDLRCSRNGDDLRCTQHGGRVAVSYAFYGRLAYHLFESIYGTMYASIPRIEASQTVFGSLYRIAMQDLPPERVPPPFAARQYVQLKGEVRRPALENGSSTT